MNAHRFLFGDDLRAPPAAEVKEQTAIETADQAGYARGYEAGRKEAALAAGLRLEQAVAQVGQGLNDVLARADLRAADIEREAVEFFVTLAEKLAGEALTRYPLASIAEAAAEAFAHLRGVPHLAVRVSPLLIDDVEAMMRRIARERGYEGRIIVLGEDDIAPGDARIEWADGGVVRAQKDMERVIGGILAGALSTLPTS